MLPYFELNDIHVGTWVIRTWGIFVSLSFVVGLWLAHREAKRRRLLSDPLIDLTIWVIIAAMIGARVFYILNEWELFRGNMLGWFKIWDGGMAMYGGMLGGGIAAWIYLGRHKLARAPYFDVLAYVMPIAIAVGRLGCFFIHDHLGRTTRFLLGIKLPEGSIRHDLGLYEILFGIGLLVFFIWWRHRSLPDGLMTAVFIMAYGGFRFGFDFLRASDVPLADPTVWLGLHPSQYVAGVSILLAAGWIFINRAKLFVKQ